MNTTQTILLIIAIIVVLYFVYQSMKPKQSAADALNQSDQQILVNQIKQCKLQNIQGGAVQNCKPMLIQKIKMLFGFDDVQSEQYYESIVVQP